MMKGMKLQNVIASLLLCKLRQKIVSTIISSQISDDEGTKVNLDGETVELMIDIGMVFDFLHCALVGMIVRVFL